MKTLCFFILLSACITQSTHAQTRKIIDVHFHTRTAGDYGPVPPPNPITGANPKAATSVDIYNNNEALLKKYNVVKAIGSGTLKRNAEFIAKDSARFLSSLEYPDHQNNPLPDTVTFKKEFEEKKFIAFGELGLQYEGKTLTDPMLEPYLAICERLSIPVLLHTGEAAPNTPYYGYPNFTIESGNPLLIEPILKKYPKLKVVLMHAGYPFLAETKAILNVYPQVTADVAVIDWAIPKEEFYDYLSSLMRAGFSKRIMYGSDQMIWEDAIPLSIKTVEEAPFLSAAQKEDIFYNNAARFFNIR